MRARTIVFVVMGSAGHMARMRSMIHGVAERGIAAYVLTHPMFDEDVTRLGGRFLDMYEGRSIDDADDSTQPNPCRYVSFAGCYAESVTDQIAGLHPSLIVTDSFATVGRVAADLLDLPFVSVRSGHNVEPATFVQKAWQDPRVTISDMCWHAVEQLRTRFGVVDASPFTYVESVSPYLNIYCEPPEYLPAETRQVFEPIEFFGSLPSPAELSRRRKSVPGTSPFGSEEGERRVYISFGTVLWRYYAPEALAAMRAISAAIARRPGVRGLITLGRGQVDPGAIEGIEGSTVSVHDYVDQWQVLADADLFVTHHGLNSTHEAIYSQVPMVSYPFFWDQPSMARHCADFGFAVPLTDKPMAPVTIERFEDVLDECEKDREEHLGALEIARLWERRVIADRPRIIDRIVALG